MEKITISTNLYGTTVTLGGSYEKVIASNNVNIKKIEDLSENKGWSDNDSRIHNGWTEDFVEEITVKNPQKKAFVVIEEDSEFSNSYYYKLKLSTYVWIPLQKRWFLSSEKMVDERKRHLM